MGISILTLSLSAKFFGISVQRDVWILAFNSILILDLAIWGPINETFRAKFIFMKEESNENDALQKARSVLVFTNAVTLCIVSLLLLFPEMLANMIAPHIKGADRDFLLLMIRVLVPSFLFNQITQIIISILNAYNSIYIPEISGFIAGVVNLLLIIVLAPTIGIFSLAYGYYFGLLLLGVLLVWQVNRYKLALFSRLTESRFSDIVPFLLFALPFFFPYFAGQIAQVIEKSIASSLGTGTVSIVDYSRKFSDILLGVLSSVFTTIMIPALSQRFAQSDFKGFFEEFRQNYQLGFLIMTVIIAMFTCCPNAFVSILYQKGNITQEALHHIAHLVMLYSWSAFCIFLYLIIGMALISSKQGKVYAFFGVSAQIIMIAFNLLMYRSMGTLVFPISLAVSHLVAAMLMLRFLPVEKRGLIKVTLFYLSVLLFIVTVMYGINVCMPVPDNSFIEIIVNGLILGFLLLSVIFAFKMDEQAVLLKVYKSVSKKIF